MYGQTTFERSFGNGLMVPSDAVLFMGKRNVVWIKVSDGMFEPREVTVGMKLDGKYQIISGINDGDEVAITGGYLIDSESQLKSSSSSSSSSSNNPNQSDKLDKLNKLSTLIRVGIVNVESIDKNKDGKVFQDPMDWNVISDKPGICPLCNMKLKEVTIKIAKENLVKHGFKVK